MRCLEQGLPECGDADLALGDAEPQQQVGVEKGFRLGELARELKSLGEVTNGVVRREGVKGRVAGLA